MYVVAAVGDLDLAVVGDNCAQGEGRGGANDVEEVVVVEADAGGDVEVGLRLRSQIPLISIR
jgi:hypothetical protein